jgi:hypothetical protein
VARLEDIDKLSEELSPDFRIKIKFIMDSDKHSKHKRRDL